METSEQRTEEFIKDLKALLLKHNAELLVEEVNIRGYRGGEYSMSVYLNSVWDENNECIKCYTEIDLGNSIDGKD